MGEQREYGPLHYCATTAECQGGRNDTANWREVDCPDCLKSRPPIPSRVTIDYTNYRGVRRPRVIEPLRFYYGSTQHHTEPQYLLDAICVEKGLRTFAMKDIHSWVPEKRATVKKGVDLPSGQA